MFKLMHSCCLGPGDTTKFQEHVPVEVLIAPSSLNLLNEIIGRLQSKFTCLQPLDDPTIHFFGHLHQKFKAEVSDILKSVWFVGLHFMVLFSENFSTLSRVLVRNVSIRKKSWKPSSELLVWWLHFFNSNFPKTHSNKRGNEVGF